MSFALQFLHTVVESSPELTAELERTLREWAPEEPPITIAFSEIGDAIVANWNMVPDLVLRSVFAKIERGMLAPEPEIRTGIATGLLEALVSATDHNSELRSKVEQLLVGASLKHFQAWRTFGRRSDD